MVHRSEKVGCLEFDTEWVEQEADYFAAVGLVFALVEDLLGQKRMMTLVKLIEVAGYTQLVGFWLDGGDSVVEMFHRFGCQDFVYQQIQEAFQSWVSRKNNYSLLYISIIYNYC